MLAGRVTRPHEDVDWLLPRRELEVRLAQARELGFDEVETVGESAPGEPFYLFSQKGDLKIDFGIADEANGSLCVRVHKIFFDVGGGEAPAGYQFRLPDDMFEHPPVQLDGVAIKPASPLALYQLRAGIAEQGSFGPLSERHLETMRRLHQAFFPELSEDALRRARAVSRAGGW